MNVCINCELALAVQFLLKQKRYNENTYSVKIIHKIKKTEH